MTLAIRDGNGSAQSIHTITLAGELAQVVGLAVGSTATHAAVAQNTADVTLLAANTNRISAKITNGTSAGNLFVMLGGVASLTAYTIELAPGSYIEISDYNGVIHGIWDAAGSGNAQVTEITP